MRAGAICVRSKWRERFIDGPKGYVTFIYTFKKTVVISNSNIGTLLISAFLKARQSAVRITSIRLKLVNNS